MRAVAHREEGDVDGDLGDGSQRRRPVRRRDGIRERPTFGEELRRSRRVRRPPVARAARGGRRFVGRCSAKGCPRTGRSSTPGSLRRRGCRPARTGHPRGGSGGRADDGGRAHRPCDRPRRGSARARCRWRTRRCRRRAPAAEAGGARPPARSDARRWRRTRRVRHTSSSIAGRRASRDDARRRDRTASLSTVKSRPYSGTHRVRPWLPPRARRASRSARLTVVVPGRLGADHDDSSGETTPRTGSAHVLPVADRIGSNRGAAHRQQGPVGVDIDRHRAEAAGQLRPVRLRAEHRRRPVRRSPRRGRGEARASWRSQTAASS